MADYKAIKGHNIQMVAGDIGTLAIGQIWYNSVLGKVRGAKFAAGAFASGGNMNNATDSGGSLGTQTAAMRFGGRPPSASGIDTTETYDGSSWTETNDMVSSDKYQNEGAGTTTAGMSIGGRDASNAFLDEVEHYDGTNWTEGTDLNSARANQGACGTNTAALCFGGLPGNQAINEHWDGSSWTEVGDLNTGRKVAMGFGTATAALYCQGITPGNDSGLTITEQWDGSSWTEVGDSNIPRAYHGGFGISTAGNVAGGVSTPSEARQAKNEEWDGTTWTEVADLATARDFLHDGKAGTTSAGIVFGGTSGPASTAKTTATEEWTSALGAVTLTSS